VKLKEALLSCRKGSYVDPSVCRDTHTFKGWPVGDGRNNQISVAFESDKSTVEQMVDAWSQQETILSFEALFIG
jgi:hypothetical protein